jgi:hypothetical protein
MALSCRTPAVRLLLQVGVESRDLLDEARGAVVAVS